MKFFRKVRHAVKQVLQKKLAQIRSITKQDVKQFAKDCAPTAIYIGFYAMSGGYDSTHRPHPHPCHRWRHRARWYELGYGLGTAGRDAWRQGCWWRRYRHGSRTVHVFDDLRWQVCHRTAFLKRYGNGRKKMQRNLLDASSRLSFADGNDFIHGCSA